jgi:hypothetical protein
MRIRSLLVAASLGSASLLAGCSGVGDDAPTPEASAALAATAASESASGSTATGAAALHPGGGALPEGWPAEAPPEHGARVWAVYLAVGPEGDPALAEAAEWLQARGYSTFEGRELGCDPRELSVAVYFDWRADAGDFLTLLKPPGSTPETTRTFVEMLRVTRDCVS